MKKFPKLNAYSNISPGWFVMQSNVFNAGSPLVISCRDGFQAQMEAHGNIMDFYFCHGNHYDNVVNFMQTVEEIAKVKNEDKLKIEPTDREDICYITLSPWWRYRVRRSLMTAFLRCGLAYKDHSGAGFLKAINSLNYTSATMQAVERFLDGFTACKGTGPGRFSGWYDQFSNKTRKPEDYLVKLKKVKKDENTNQLQEN